MKANIQNKHLHMNQLKKYPILGATAGVLFCATAAQAVVQAANFTFQNQDMILGMRESGNLNEMVINLGQASKYNTRSGERFQVGGYSFANSPYTQTQIEGVFGGLAGVEFSIGGGQNTFSSNPAWKTLWVAKGSEGPVVNQGSTANGSTLARMQSVGTGAQTYSANNNLTYESATAVAIPQSANVYSKYAGSDSNGGGSDINWQNTFQFNAEVSIPSAFDQNVYAYLYTIKPNTTAYDATQYLGIFEFQPDGDLYFTPVPEPSTYGMITGLGLVVLSMGRYFRRSTV